MCHRALSLADAGRVDARSKIGASILLTTLAAAFFAERSVPCKITKFHQRRNPCVVLGLRLMPYPINSARDKTMNPVRAAALFFALSTIAVFAVAGDSKHGGAAPRPSAVVSEPALLALLLTGLTGIVIGSWRGK